MKSGNRMISYIIWNWVKRNFHVKIYQNQQDLSTLNGCESYAERMTCM